MSGRLHRQLVAPENKWIHRCPSVTIDSCVRHNSSGRAGGHALLHHREYRLLITAVSLSIFAEGMWAVVMALQVIELDNNPTSLSLVATCLGAGLVGFVLVGGIAADRLNQRSIIIAARRSTSPRSPWWPCWVRLGC